MIINTVLFYIIYHVFDHINISVLFPRHKVRNKNILNCIDTNLGSNINDSITTLDVSNLINKNACDIDHGCSLLFGIQVNVSNIDMKDFKRMFKNIPTKFKKNYIRKQMKSVMDTLTRQVDRERRRSIQNK